MSGLLTNPNAVLAYPNWILPQYDANYTATPSLKTPTFSIGSWNPSFPLSNMTSGQLYKTVKSTSAAVGSPDFIVDLQVARPLSVFAFIRHNASPAASGTNLPAFWSVTVSNDPTFATFAWTGTSNFYQPFFSPSALPFGWSGGTFTGNPSQFDLQNYASFCSPIFADQIYVARYIAVNVHDASNTSGAFQFGGFFAGPGFQPTVNLQYGAQLAWRDESTVSQSWAGVRFATRKARRRTAQFSYQALSVDQGMQIPFEIEAGAGTTEQVLFCVDPTSAYNVNRWTFLANIESLDPIVWPSYNITSAQIRLVEVL